MAKITKSATQRSPYRRKVRRPGSTSRSAQTTDMRRSARTERDVSIALLYNAGIPASRLSAISGLSETWIREIVNRFNAQFEPASRELIHEPTAEATPTRRKERVPT